MPDSSSSTSCDAVRTAIKAEASRALLAAGSTELARKYALSAQQDVLCALEGVEGELAGRISFVVERLHQEEKAVRAAEKAGDADTATRDEQAERWRKYHMQELIYGMWVADLSLLHVYMAEGTTKPNDHPELSDEVGSAAVATHKCFAASISFSAAVPRKQDMCDNAAMMYVCLCDCVYLIM